MIKSVQQRRNIPKDTLTAIKNKLYHPKDALALKLVDSIGTFEEFVDVNFPNHNIENVVYKVDGVRLSHNLTDREISALTTFF
jgi:ClpP class serine protease